MINKRVRGLDLGADPPCIKLYVAYPPGLMYGDNAKIHAFEFKYLRIGTIIGR